MMKEELTVQRKRIRIILYVTKEVLEKRRGELYAKRFPRLSLGTRAFHLSKSLHAAFYFAKIEFLWISVVYRIMASNTRKPRAMPRQVSSNVTVSVFSITESERVTAYIM